MQEQLTSEKGPQEGIILANYIGGQLRHFHMTSVPLNQHEDAINQGQQEPLCSRRRNTFFNEQNFPSPLHAHALHLEERRGALPPESVNIIQGPDYSKLTESWKFGILLSPGRPWSLTQLRDCPWPLSGQDPHGGPASSEFNATPPPACKEATVKWGSVITCCRAADGIYI